MKGGSVPVAGGARIATAVVADLFPLVEHGLPPFVSRNHPPCQALPFGNLLSARPIAMPLDPVEHEEVGLLGVDGVLRGAHLDGCEELRDLAGPREGPAEYKVFEIGSGP